MTKLSDVFDSDGLTLPALGDHAGFVDDPTGTPVTAVTSFETMPFMQMRASQTDNAVPRFDTSSVANYKILQNSAVIIDDSNNVSGIVGLTFTGAVIGGVDSITATSSTVAASIVTASTHITTNGDSDLDDVSLANGTAGQIKHFVVKAVGNAADSVKITPATMVGGTQITFAANPLGLGCTMVYTSTGWVVSANNGGTIA